MQYWGKLIGFVLGLVLGRSFYSALLGLIIGHFFDQMRSKNQSGFFTNQQVRSSLFFKTTFQVMGHLSKSKGRVTPADIQIAAFFMDRMKLNPEAKAAAQQAFREGKEPNYPLRVKLQELRRICFGRADLLRTFLEFQLQAAFADGVLHPNEREVLYVIAEELGMSRAQFDQFLRMIEGGQQFGNQGNYSRQSGYQSRQPGPTLEDAYKVLGIKSNDEPTTIKRAYRKLMGEHHPDKLVAKGLPPEMMELAKQKAQEIQAAYDFVKKEKGFK